MKVFVGGILPSLASLEPCSGFVKNLPQSFDAYGANNVIVHKVFSESWQCPCGEVVIEFVGFVREVCEYYFLF